MDLTADYSAPPTRTWKEYRDRSIRSARSFFAKATDVAVRYDFELMERGEWERLAATPASRRRLPSPA